MARSYTYISADSHLEVDSKRWVDRVPLKFRDRAPRLVRTPNGGDAWAVENRPLIPNPGDLYGGKGREVWKPFGQRYEDTPGTGSPEQRLSEQDQDGIDAEVLFPPQAGGARLWRAISDDGPYLACVRAYNDFLAEDYCSVAPDRLIADRNLEFDVRIVRRRAVRRYRGELVAGALAARPRCRAHGDRRCFRDR